MALVALLVMSIVLLGLVFSQKGREQALKILKETKDKLYWNGVILMTYANYIGLAEKAKDKITEDNNLSSGICSYLALLAYPVLAGLLLVRNHRLLDSNDFRKKY
jgi:hypothetical protein